MSACAFLCVCERQEKRRINADFITLINSVCMFFIMFSSVPSFIKVVHLRSDTWYMCIDHWVCVCVGRGGFKYILSTQWENTEKWHLRSRFVCLNMEICVCVCVHKFMYGAFTFPYACSLPCSYFSISCRVICQNPKRADWLSRCAGNATISIITSRKKQKHSLQKSIYPSNECARKATETNATSCRERLHLTPVKQQSGVEN